MGISATTFLLLELVGVISLLSIWELRKPFLRPDPEYATSDRKITHLTLMVLNQGARLVVRFGVLWLASIPIQSGAIGLLNQFALPPLFALIAGVVLLDVAEYWRHRLMHTRHLWAIHLVHHCDRHVDWSTEFRFHPLEAALSTLFLTAAIVLLGISPASVAVFAFVVLANGMIQHANVSLGRHDRPLSAVFATPAVHRVHHTTNPERYDTNFGAVFTWWDRCFGTFRTPQSETRFGSDEIPAAQASGLKNMLALPFRSRGARAGVGYS